ncbi:MULTISPECIES: DoxX family protein [unclassified Halorhodospira]|uniref:DoxX family protein n=1 Tax=unclassified Halorhodospira TaxID=2626748 RepID=UPI001EE89C9E|nr:MULTISPECIES: DoxX family protein [unclassified Halorhodospira]MCG5541286.1 DoxX family protein [Halorhodospira sp. M39old]MCG5546504.1 DoxX family protein [Halorhodospira sp. M38]
MQTARDLLFGGVAPATLVADAGLTALRVGAGLMMAVGHGLPKIPPHEGFVGMVEGIGLPVPLFFAWLAGIAELIGGLLLAAGLLTRPAAAVILGTMLVAAFGVHFAAGDPLFAVDGPSAEMAVLYAFVALSFMLVGSGRLGVDHLVRERVARLTP